MEKMLSIIIPVYNTEKYFKRCLDSVIQQKYSNLEIVIVDDGSTDSCGNLSDEYAKIDSRIKVIQKKNGGLVAARKTGVENACGEYVAYVDSDDWIEPDSYDDLMRIAEKYKPDFIACSFYKNYEGMQSIREDYPQDGSYSKCDIEKLIMQADEKESFFCQIINSSLCCKLLKKSFLLPFQEAVPDEVIMSEDMAVVLPMLMNANSIYVSKKPFYHYFQNRNSMSYEWKEGAFGRWRVLIEYLLSTLDRDISEGKKHLVIESAFYSMMEILYDVPQDYWEKGIPFLDEIKKESRVVIYGKGSYATNIISVMNKNNMCQVVLNVDSTDSDKLFSMESDEYDYVVIAILDNLIVKKIRQYLEQNNVDENKIVEINKEKLSVENLPTK